LHGEFSCGGIRLWWLPTSEDGSGPYMPWYVDTARASTKVEFVTPHEPFSWSSAPFSTSCFKLVRARWKTGPQRVGRQFCSLPGHSHNIFIMTYCINKSSLIYSLSGMSTIRHCGSPKFAATRLDWLVQLLLTLLAILADLMNYLTETQISYLARD